MALLRLKDFEPNYRDAFDGADIKGIEVYTENTNQKIGSVDDILVDETGRLRYLIVDIGFWIFGKKVLLPIGRSHGDWKAQRVYANLTKEQAEDLPEFHDQMIADFDYEERVRGVYRAPARRSSGDREAPLEAPVPLEATASSVTYPSPVPGAPAQPSATRNDPTVPVEDHRTPYDYHQDSSLYDLNDKNHQALKLYEERLVVNKQRRKSGEVTVGKRIETETARASVPVQRERVVIERAAPTATGNVSPSSTNFQAGEVTRMDLYEETPDIRKEAFVREEVSVRKEVEHDSINSTETLRREELDVNSGGHPVVDDPSTHSGYSA